MHLCRMTGVAKKKVVNERFFLMILTLQANWVTGMSGN